ncbi:MAG TPA: biosynthetic-type acetolactate synthase large subunit [Candidatus Limnocylindria bacterium]|nr:biosynthetic-type acetolactate synthase large subunit [Candidatus Limnocylindria bacterium]
MPAFAAAHQVHQPGPAIDASVVAQRGADLIWRALERAGVENVFGYPGGATLPMYDALPDHPGIHHVLVRHEQGAAHMADGYARATGRVGVCSATSGPGATNLVTGLACAFMDSVPVVAVTGQVSSPLMGRDAFQETDVIGMVGPITKHAFLVERVEDIEPTIQRAFSIARSGRPGPVVVDIPKDVQLRSAAPETGGSAADAALGGADVADLERAVALLASASRPVIIAGHGIRLSRAHAELRTLAERIDAPVVTTLLGIGAIDESHPLAVGMLGMHGSATANRIVNDADVILGVGLRFDDRVTGKLSAFAPRGQIIHADIDPTQIGKNVPTAVGIVADAGAVLFALAARLERTARAEWRARATAERARPRLSDNEDRIELPPRLVVRAIRETASDDAYFVADVGQHQMWAAQHLRLTHPDRFITSGGLGAMGYALPAAIGVQLGRPASEVWAIAGDGGSQMTIHELGTAVQEGAPVKLAILNNGYLGMVRQWQQLFHDGRISQTPISSPDYVKLAEAYGVLGLCVERRRDLEATLQRARSHSGPVVIDVRIEREANVWPIVPPGGANADLIEEPAG